MLRYWETEFEGLRPKKNRAGNRVYTERDIEVVERIQRLLRDEKYTIEGARAVLARDAPAEASDAPTEASTDAPSAPSLPRPDASRPLGDAQRRDLLALRAFLSDVLQRL